MKILLTIAFLWSSAFAQKVLKTEENVNGVKSMRVVINLGTTELNLKRVNDQAKAFRLDYGYSEDEKVPVLEYDVDGDVGVLHLSNEGSHGSFPFFGLHGDKDSVNIELANSLPISLKMKFGVGDANVDLGGMHISDAAFSTGVCDFNLKFSSPNLIECDDVEIKTGISSISVKNLSNARAKYIEINGGLGSMKIDFGGRLQRDCEVKVNSGLGSVEISIPSDINTSITAPGNFVNSVDVSGFYAQGDGAYHSDKKTGPQLKINVDSGMGSVTIRSY
ncbi:MAG: hypothetical protein WAO19_08510 [Candidatus Kryptoniota bacterium]